MKVLQEISVGLSATKAMLGAGMEGHQPVRKEVMNLSLTRSEMAPKQVGPQDWSSGHVLRKGKKGQEGPVGEAHRGSCRMQRVLGVNTGDGEEAQGSCCPSASFKMSAGRNMGEGSDFCSLQRTPACWVAEGSGGEGTGNRTHGESGADGREPRVGEKPQLLGPQ